MSTRKPSIHITEELLAKLLEEKFQGTGVYRNWLDIAEDISKQARKKQLTNRKLVVSNDKLIKQATKVVKSSVGDVEMLNRFIFYIRKTKTKLYIREKFKVGSNDYKQLKELAEICNDFCNQFSFDKKDGYTKYLMVCIPLVNSSMNYVGKLINMAEKVYNHYNSLEEIKGDDNPQETKFIYEYYIGKIATNTGLKGSDVIKLDNHYGKFLEVRKLTDELNIPIEIFIDAQFEGLAWTDNFPEPSQLINDKAVERVNKYIYKNKIKVTQNKPTQSNDTLKNKLLKLKKDGKNNS